MWTDKQDTEFSVSECADRKINDADLEIVQKAYRIINLSGRGKEFLAALKGISDGSLNIHNIVMKRCDLQDEV